MRPVVKKLASGRNLGVAGATVMLALVIGCGGGGGGGGGGGTTATTSTSTTSTATTSTSTATTAGVLPVNTILYAVPNGSGTDYELAGLDPVNAGTSSTIVSDFPASILLFAANPNVKSQYVAAYDPTFASAADNGLYGIYTSTGLSTSSIKQLVAPTYVFVSSLSVTDNGKYVVYSATDQSGASSLFVESLSGGAPVNYGLSDGSTVSPSDDDTLVYVAIPSSGNTVLDQVFSRSLKAGASGKANQITTDAVNHAIPAISRDGTQIAYWEEGTANNLLVQPIAAGSATTTLQNPSGLVPQAEAFSGDSSAIAIAAVDPSYNGYIDLQTPNSTSTPSTLLEVPNTPLGNYGIYWTSSNGRVAGGFVGASSAVRKRMAVGRALRPALHIR